MKYRRLRKDELEELEDQFIQFLAANTITKEDWVTLKEKHPDQVHGLIDIFSDTVFDSVLEKVNYLEHRMAKEIKLFYCEAEKISLVGLRVDTNLDIDFTKNEPATEMLSKIKKAKPGSVKVFQAEKRYKLDRKQELFKLMEGGALISNGSLYQMLVKM